MPSSSQPKKGGSATKKVASTAASGKPTTSTTAKKSPARATTLANRSARARAGSDTNYYPTGTGATTRVRPTQASNRPVTATDRRKGQGSVRNDQAQTASARLRTGTASGVGRGATAAERMAELGPKPAWV